MDKTMEIVVAAMVALMVATIVLFLVQDRTESFDGFLDGQQEGAECELLKAQDKCEEFNSRSSCSGTCQEPSQECPKEGEVPNKQGKCVQEDSLRSL